MKKENTDKKIQGQETEQKIKKSSYLLSFTHLPFLF